MSTDRKPPSSAPDSDSLVRRLAGPSTMKAGLAKDQTEINRIIAEASKGSKFYENEKRKDKDLTQRIERIAKQRDEVTRGVDLVKVEQAVDKLLAQLESQRDLSQTIVHVDMDAFFANVELLDNPDLAGKAFGVGGGVLTTASYEARKFGVRSGMPAFIAKKLCPELIITKINGHRYGEMSAVVMDIFRRYDSTMCPVSVDEAYLNITQYCEEHALTAEECVQQMRRAVQEETQLTVSAGIAPNRLLAKICSDKNKPNGQFKLSFEPEAIKSFMHDLSIRKIPGVGRVNERLLESIGIWTCGDIFKQRAVLSLMDKQFGLVFLLQTYLGISSNVVQPHERDERKSIGAERTFHPISDQARILAKLEDVAVELEKDMESTEWTGKTITLKYKLDTYQVFTRAKSLDRWLTGKKEELFAIGKELLTPELPLTLRLIGLRVTKLKDLRADAEAKARGIKRFFGAAPPSPRKKRRITAVPGEDDPRDTLSLSQDGYEVAMPGFFEHDDGVALDDYEEVQVIEEARSKPKSSSVNVTKAPLSSDRRPSRPPVSARASDSSSSNLTPSAQTNRMSSPQAADPGTASRSADAEGFSCPICGKTLDTDNDGFNAHIDFCLSKQAIKEAQAASLKQHVPKPPSTTSRKPASRTNRPAQTGTLNFKKR